MLKTGVGIYIFFTQRLGGTIQKSLTGLARKIQYYKNCWNNYQWFAPNEHNLWDWYSYKWHPPAASHTDFV